jgi:xylulokinase
VTLICGVDSSTQSCKVLIRDLETGALVRSGRAPHPDGTEVDPQAWWEALARAIEQAGGLADVAAVAIAGQQHGLVALDGDGRVIRPALLWNDTRSAQAARDLVAEIGAGELARRTGSVPVASFTVTKLRWLRDHEPASAARVAALALPHDWLTWRLRGYGPRHQAPLGPRLEELTTDRSEASGTGYFDPVAGAYDRGLLERALGRAEGIVLPRVLGPGERAGLTPGGTILAAGAGDNAAAALGLGSEPGEVVISIGTSGTVFATSQTPSAEGTGTVAGFADATGRYLPIVTKLNAARVPVAVAALLGVSLDELAQLALAAAPGSGGLVLIPYFEGERTPNLPEASASLLGLTLASATRENLARAAYEGVLCGLAAGLEALRAVGVRERRLALIGGGAQSPALQRVATQVFDAPITVPEPGEYVAHGDAIQAAWALTGERPSWPLTPATGLQPDPQPAIRAQYARAHSHLSYTVSTPL